MIKKYLFLLFFYSGIACAKGDCVFDNFTPQRVNNYVRNLIVDSYDISKELFSQRSLKILSAFIPLYLTSRHVDKGIHSHFYDAANHENKHQPPQWLQVFSEYEVMEIPAWFCRFFSVLHRDPRERRAMQIFTTGMTWSLVAKLAIKQVVKSAQLEAGLRPLHPGFSRDWKYYHGIPSGHSLLIAYTATYLGLYKGRYYGIPLGLYTGFVMGMRVAGNHHYLSQVLTGAVIGILFGASSYAVFDNKIALKNLAFNIVSDGPSRIGVSVAYDF